MKAQFKIFALGALFLSFTASAAVVAPSIGSQNETLSVRQKLEQIAETIHEKSGPIEGEVTDVTPEQLAELRQQLEGIQQTKSSTTAQKAYAHILLNKLPKSSTAIERVGEQDANETAAQDVW